METNETSQKVWTETPLSDLASDAARMAGVGDPTDAGWTWTLPSEYPDLIPLGGGIPDAPSIPTEQFREALNAVLDEEPDDAMVYGGWMGFEGLRDLMAERQNRIEGLDLDASNFIIHNGSSAAMDNIAKAFINPGDVAIVEGPSFSGIVEAIQSYMAEVVEVPIDDDGMSLEAVAAVIAESEAAGKTVKMIYTIPDYHNPTGVTMSAPASESSYRTVRPSSRSHGGGWRLQRTLLRQSARRHRRFTPCQTVIGVMRVGSFSKVAATGLRIGWVQARPEFINALTKVRFDMGTSPILLRAMARYLQSGHLEIHVEEMRRALRSQVQDVCATHSRNTASRMSRSLDPMAASSYGWSVSARPRPRSGWPPPKRVLYSQAAPRSSTILTSLGTSISGSRSAARPSSSLNASGRNFSPSFAKSLTDSTRIQRGNSMTTATLIPAPISTAAPESVGLDPERLAVLDFLIERHISDKPLPWRAVRSRPAWQVG